MDCGDCLDNENMQKNNVTALNPEFYMAWHKDDDILASSSSGGAFSAIADYVIDRGGVVFGAALDPETRIVKHISVVSKEGLNKLRLSKYYQSQIGDAYKSVREFLAQGRVVLFSGTACQIASLYKICGNPSNLITVDVLCHGVTSKLVVDSYIKSQELKFKKKITSFAFRVKSGEEGWQSGGGTRMKLEFSDGSCFVANKNTDTFFTGFNTNLILRDSCYRCPYCGTERISDFTIADFWGVAEERASKEQARKGISVIAVNSEKGKSLFNKMAKELEIEPISATEVTPYNRAFSRPNDRPQKRDEFFQRLKHGDDYNKIIGSLARKRLLKRKLRVILGEEWSLKIKRLLKRS